MKIIIEKKLETLKDLRTAKKSLAKKARRQEANLMEKLTDAKAELNPKRVYGEILDSFSVNNLALELLPYALRYMDQLVDNPIVRALAKIDKKRLPVIIGSVTAAGFFSYAYFTKAKGAGKSKETAQPAHAENGEVDECFV